LKFLSIITNKKPRGSKRDEKEKRKRETTQNSTSSRTRKKKEAEHMRLTAFSSRLRVKAEPHSRLVPMTEEEAPKMTIGCMLETT